MIDTKSTTFQDIFTQICKTTPICSTTTIQAVLFTCKLTINYKLTILYEHLIIKKQVRKNACSIPKFEFGGDMMGQYYFLICSKK
jgi:hypothetical protein